MLFYYHYVLARLRCQARVSHSTWSSFAFRVRRWRYYGDDDGDDDVRWMAG